MKTFLKYENKQKLRLQLECPVSSEKSNVNRSLKQQCDQEGPQYDRF